MNMLERIEAMCKDLPEGWRVRIEIERDAAYVIVIRPNGSIVSMDDGEYDLEEQLEAAAGFISDEETADAILGREAEEMSP